jgi:hypothetical protein
MNISQNSARDMMIYELGSMFAARLGLEELIPLVISKCREVLDAGGISVLLLDAERDELYFPYISEENPEAGQGLWDLRVPSGSGLARRGAAKWPGGKDRRSAIRPSLLLRRRQKDRGHHEVAAGGSADCWA